MHLRFAATLTALALASAAGPARAAVVINEVLGSTAGNDVEFIELYNTGSAAVDISGYQIFLYDSDAGTVFGGLDGGSPYTVAAGTTLGAGGFFLFANALAVSQFGVTPGFTLPANAIENSSYTMILKDAGGNTLFSAFVTDGGTDDAANDAGTAITPTITVGPDGPFLPAGYYLHGDGDTGDVRILEFDPPFASATPGASNPGTPGGVIPEPASIVLLGLGGLGLILGRRRPAA